MSQNTIKFVGAIEACNALVNAYPHLISLKTPAQIYFRYVKIAGRQGKRMTKKQVAERQALIEEMTAWKQGA